MTKLGRSSLKMRDRQEEEEVVTEMIQLEDRKVIITDCEPFNSKTSQ